MIGKYCIIRSKNAGVFAATVSVITETLSGKDVLAINARRIWYWSGAASLSQLAMEGTKDPKNCKFPCTVPSVLISEVIEIIPITEVAAKSISEVPIWKK